MNKYDARGVFSKLSRQAYFVRVDETHPLNLHLGMDSEGKKALRFLGEFNPVKITGTKTVQVKQMMVDGKKCIQFSLIEPDSADLFYTFCNDLIDSSRIGANQAGGYHFVITRFAKWKHMFVTKRDILSEQEIMGLLGELHFLMNYMIPKYGTVKAVASWSASDPTVKDFSLNDTWFEVKTTGPKSATVRIGSLQQLSFTSPGTLVVVRLEKMSKEYQGISLNSMIRGLLSIIESPEECEELETKLYLRKYVYDERYDDFVFEVSDTLGFTVGEGFPSLRLENVNEAIVNAEYDLAIDKLEPFKVDLKA